MRVLLWSAALGAAQGQQPQNPSPMAEPSTTETADYLLQQLHLARRPVLKWGPMGLQQLSEARAGQFLLVGYAGDSAPDQVDQLHSVPDFLK